MFFLFFVGSPLGEKSHNMVDGRTSNREENSRKPMMIEPNINSKNMDRSDGTIAPLKDVKLNSKVINRLLRQFSCDSKNHQKITRIFALNRNLLRSVLLNLRALKYA